jgi:hypothetical protein
MDQAVKRSRKRRQDRIVFHLGIDEKIVKKGHRHFTIVSDLDRGEVLWIGRGRKRESLDPILGHAFPRAQVCQLVSLGDALSDSGGDRSRSDGRRQLSWQVVSG